MKNKDFAAFILTHGRPDNVITYKTLKKAGYTGKIYIIIDNEDKTGEQYYKNFGKENVIIFDKKAIAKTVDNGDNFNDLRTTTHVRNAIFEIAKKLNIIYFIQLDDDYTSFNFTSDENFNYKRKATRIKNINYIFDALLTFYKKTNILSICMAQGGDFIGGENSGVLEKGLSRKAMNSFICSTKRPFKFISRLNEDVNTYMSLGAKGDVFITTPLLRLEQKETQTNVGGMSETYIDNGTYIKSFFTVMYCPSFTKVALMGYTKQRLHHRISWKNAVPVILDEKYKK